MDKSYDVNAIFAEMEQELISGYRRNMARHLAEETRLGIDWSMWQTRKLGDLIQYKKEARRIVDKHTKRAKVSASQNLAQEFISGAKGVDKILQGMDSSISDIDSFGKINRYKLDALIDAVHNDFTKAGDAALRLVDDQYRKIVFSSQVKYAAGATTLPKAIDMAAKDFLAAGINAVQYSNGNNVNVASYAEMCMRTANKKAYLTGEGARQAEWGEYLCQVTSYGGCSPKCLYWQGKVYVNDVYAGGTADGKHPLLSTAMANGLFHPNCRHTAQPFFEGISQLPPPEDEAKVRKTYAAEQKQRGIERKIREYKRVQAGSLDPANQADAAKKVKQWQGVMRQHLKDNDFLSRRSYRERI